MRKDNAKLNRCKKLLETPPKVDRNREPPKCRCCPYYQTDFRYRKCLYATCPYGKERKTPFRNKPLRVERIVMGGGDMRRYLLFQVGLYPCCR